MSFNAESSGQCPHCRTMVRFEKVRAYNSANGNMGVHDHIRLTTPSDRWIDLLTSACPACGKPVLLVLRTGIKEAPALPLNYLVWPDSSERPVPQDVEAEAPQLAADYREAVAILRKSKKASAALSRRCLQAILVSKGGVKARDLAGQIEEALTTLPVQIAQNVDAIRQVGNFAAHPIKSKSTGEIVEVEEGEAEWLLEVIEELFSHYYVAPARAAARRQTLNLKLQELGKPPLKTP
jgi:hypothetical protein